MRLLSRCGVLSFLWLAATAAGEVTLAPLPDAAEPALPACTAECRRITLPLPAALTLLPQLRDDRQAEAACAKLEALIARGEATVTVDLLGRGTFGQQLVCFPHREFKYATAWEPEGQGISYPAPEGTAPPGPPVPMSIASTTTADVGPSLELEIARSSAPGVFTAEVTVLETEPGEARVCEVGPLRSGQRLTVEVPSFPYKRADHWSTFRDGLPKLLAVDVGPGAAATVALTFVTLRSPAGAPLLAPDSAPPPPEIRLAVQMVGVPLAEARRLVPQLRQPATFAAAEARVQELLAAGEAELLGWPMLSLPAAPGARWRSAAVIRPVVDETDSDWGGGSFHPPPDPPQRRSRNLPYILPLFEFWPSGAKLDADIVAEPSKGPVRLRITAACTAFLGYRLPLGAAAAAPHDHQIERAIFAQRQSEAYLALSSPERRLLDAFADSKPRPRMVLFLLHADLLPAP